MNLLGGCKYKIVNFLFTPSPSKFKMYDMTLIMLQVDIVYLACMEQKYVTVHLLWSAHEMLKRHQLYFVKKTWRLKVEKWLCMISHWICNSKTITNYFKNISFGMHFIWGINTYLFTSKYRRGSRKFLQGGSNLK